MMEVKTELRRLQDRERDEIISNAKSFFLDRKDILSTYRKKHILFGCELEHTLVTKDGLLPALGLGEKIVKKLKDKKIKQEYGSFQIEHNSSKRSLRRGCFTRLLCEIGGQRRKIAEIAEKRGAYVLSSGLTPTFPSKYLEKDFLSKDIGVVGKKLDFHKDSPIYFTGRHHEKICVHGSDEAWSIINSMHVHIQGRDIMETLKIFNYSQMCIPLITAVSSNASYFNSLINEEDVRMSIICGKRRSLHGRHTGYIMDYPKNIDEFFEKLFKVRPWLRYESNGRHTPFLDVMVLTEVNSFFTQIRLDRSKTNPIRVEFKVISVQPTVKENVALTMFYILLVYYLMKKRVGLVESRKVYHDLFKAMKKGINARLNFVLDGGSVQMPAYELLDQLLPRISSLALKDGLIDDRESKILLSLEDRAVNKSTPSTKLRKLIELEGESQGLKRFTEYSHKDIVI